MVEFPNDFLWGAATSAYQVEGNNINSDWWLWEKEAGLKETSGEACGHYQFYKEDFDLAKLLNHNAHRLSIEWSRVEPEEGIFSPRELDHYTDVLLCLKQRHIEPIVTLHHFTNPLWFAKLGGWQNKDAPRFFLRYVKKAVETLCDKVNYWITINEPMVYIYHSYVLGLWPPQQKSFLKAKRAMENLLDSHIKAYQLIHAIYKKRNLSHPLKQGCGLFSPSVSIAKHLQAFVSCAPSLKNKFAVYLRDRFFNFEFIERLLDKRALDFIGINYYTRGLVDVKKWRFKNLMLDICNQKHDGLKQNSLGWDIYPQGINTLLLSLKKYDLPVFILENGICTQDEALRWDFIYQHLKNIHLAMREGIRVLGYIYWSLIDNFEWDKGFAPRFGLVEVDYRNLKRQIRDCAKKFSLVCKTGRLD